jgi:hypothetical protein
MSYAFESRYYLGKLHIYVKSGNDVVTPCCVSHLNSRDLTAVLANIDKRTRAQSINIWDLSSSCPLIYHTNFLEPVTQFYRRRCLLSKQDSLAVSYNALSRLVFRRCWFRIWARTLFWVGFLFPQSAQTNACVVPFTPERFLPDPLQFPQKDDENVVFAKNLSSYWWWYVCSSAGFIVLTTARADHSGRPRGLKHERNAGIVSSNPTEGMDVRVSLFCVCVVVCR